MKSESATIGQTKATTCKLTCGVFGTRNVETFRLWTLFMKSVFVPPFMSRVKEL